MSSVFFWKPHEENGYLSNWYTSKFVDSQGVTYYNTKQYLMYQKAILFKDFQAAKLILNTKNPKLIKELGRKVSNFEETIWIKNRENIMYDGCFYKFSQNSNLKTKLLSTGDNQLVESSPFDKIWGIGLNKYQALKQSNWPGLNLLGKVLIKVRKTLK
jgi:ribA/ribD-fused uncharacterized protein